MAETFDFEASDVFIDKETRTITGLSYPTGGSAKRNGVNLSFAANSVEFGDRTPLLLHHDTGKPVGRLVSAEWTDQGLATKFSVAKTSAGDEALELASQGILGFSMGVDITKHQMSKDGSSMTVLAAHGHEVSLVSLPAFAGALVDSVAFSAETIEQKGSVMTEDNGAVLAALNSINENLEKFNDRPAVVPTAVAKVNEAPLYNLDGPGGRFNFSADVVSSFKGDGVASQRVSEFITEKFAVTSTDAMPGVAPSFRPEVGYSNLRPYGRVLDQVITRGTISDNQPFSYPILNGVTGTLVAPHVEGVEPTLAGGATWSTQTITPSALSGKVAFTRETIDLVGGMAQSLLFAEMTKAAERAAEARLRTLLDGLTLPAGQVKAVNGQNVALMDALDTMRLGLTEPQRFNGAVASPALFTDLFLAKDTSGGRRLNTAVNAVNANGTNNGTQSISANGLTFIQGRDTDSNGTTNSYLIDSSCVYQWLTAPRRLDFDIEVAKVYMGFFMYSAEAVTDKSGIIRITHA